jgi:hypothetical protein
VRWKNTRPAEPGFYYWQSSSLRAISPDAVRVVQVSRYANREGFNCHTLTRSVNDGDTFDCDLGREPTGRWAGPLPQPY